MSAPGREQIDVVSRDGARSRMSVFPPREPGTGPVVLCMPAMGVAARFYEPLALALQDAGIDAVTSDLRGVGESSVRADRGTTFGYRHLVELDFPANVAAVKRRFPARRVVLLGHSLGGQLSLLYASREPEAVAGVVIVASGSVYFRAYPFPLNVKVLLGTQASRIVAQAYGYFPGDRLRFAGREARDVMVDWATQALHGDYGGTLGAGYEDSLRRAKLKVLAITVDNDTLAPASAVEHLCKKLQSSEVTRWHFFRHEADGHIDHFRWVKRARPVVSRVKGWLASA